MTSQTPDSFPTQGGPAATPSDLAAEWAAGLDTPADTGDTPGDTRAGSSPGPGLSDHATTGAAQSPVESSEDSAESVDDADLEPDEVVALPGTATLTRHNWDAVRRRYVEGSKNPETGMIEWLSLNGVADQFGIVGQRVREKSSQQGWVEQRRTFQAQVEATRRAAKANAMAKAATDLDGKALSAAEMGLQLCLAALGDLGRRAEAWRRANIGNPDAGAMPVDALEQSRLAQAVQLWHQVGLRAIGDPDVRVELTGAGGGPIEITQELRRDDPDRLGAVLAVLELADLGGVVPGHVIASAADDLARGADGLRAPFPPRR